MNTKPTYNELVMENIKLQKQIDEQKNQSVLTSQLQQLSKIGSWELDLNSHIITFSPEACALIDMEAKETTYAVFEFAEKYSYAVDLPNVKKQLNIALENRNIKDYTGGFSYRILTVKGNIKYLKVVYYFKSKDILTGVTTDVTEQIKAKEALKKERNLFSDGPVCTLIWSPEKHGPIKYASENIAQILGYTPSEMTKSKFHYDQLIHKEDLERITKESEYNNKNNINSYEQTYRFLTKKKDYRWLYDFTKLMRNHVGEVIEIRGYMFDQTDLIQANKALSVSEHNFRLLADYNYDWEYWVDKNGKYVYLSPACERITGYKPEEFINNPNLFHSLIRPDYSAKVIEHNQNEININRPVHQMEFPIFNKDGEECWIEHHCSVVYDDDGSFAGRRGNNRDITKRKAAENELISAKLRIEKSEKKFRKLFEKSGDANLIIENGLFVDCNQSAIEMLGYNNRQEVIDTHPSKISPEIQLDGRYSLEKADEMMQIALNRGSHRFEWNHKRNDDSIFPCEVHLTSISNSPSKKLIHAVISDISKRKQAEQELSLHKEKAEENEMQFRAISEQSTEGITVADLKGNYVFVNPSFCKMSGYSLKELLKLTVFDMKTKNQSHKSFYESKEKMQGLPIHVNLQKKDGTRYTTEMIGKLITINNQQFVLRTIRDVSERVKKEKEIIDAKNRAKKSEAQIRAIVEQSPLSIQIFNNHGLTINANDSWGKLWNSNKEKVIGKYNVLTDEYADEIGWLKYIRKAFKGETVYLSDMEYDPSKSGNTGRVRILDCVVFPIKYKGEVEQVVIIHQDITAKKEQDLELINAKERAEESDRLKSAFLANMSHEIRTPMNGILGFTSLLKEPDCTHEEQLEFISVIERSGFRLLGIINDLIDISKIEAGLMDIFKSKVSVNEQLEYMFAFFHPEVESKNMILQLNELPSDQIISTDKEKFLAILTNLIKNSIKYSKDGTIEFGYNNKGNYLEFYVKDKGIGIAHDKLLSIFERFVQADNTLASSYEGAGLGLSITKAFVELLGGKIWVQSELDVGTQFYFTLPVF